MYYLILLYLYFCGFVDRRASFILSVLALCLFVFLRGEVGGDNISYVERGLFALSEPTRFIHEPFTLLFAHVSDYTGIPLPNWYSLLIVLLLSFGVKDIKNKMFWPVVFLIFVAPIAIGYLRQALAVVFLLPYVYARFKFIWAVFAIIAHPSSIIFIAIYEVCEKLKLKSSRSIIKLGVGVATFSLVGFFSGVMGSLEHYFTHYGENSGFESTGYLFRALFYLSLVFCLKNYFKKNELFVTLSILASCLIFYIVFGASTAADRLQIYSFVIILPVLGRVDFRRANYILFLSGLYFFIWFSMSKFAQAHWQYEFLVELL